MSDAVARYTVTMDFYGGSPGLENESGKFVYARDDADELGRKGYGKHWQVVLATDYDALEAENVRLKVDRDRLRYALVVFQKAAQRYWREGEEAYKFTIVARAALAPAHDDAAKGGA